MTGCERAEARAGRAESLGEALEWLRAAGVAGGLALAVGLDVIEGPAAVLLAATQVLGALETGEQAPAASRLLSGVGSGPGIAELISGSLRALARLLD